MNVAQQLVQQLIDAGVSHIYGIVGDSLNPIVDAVRKSGGSARGALTGSTYVTKRAQPLRPLPRPS